MTRSYAAGPTERPLLDETIGFNLRRAAERHARRDALVVCHQDVRLTYAELDAAVDTLARALMALGLERGDRLGIWAPNRAEWVLTQFATARIGIVLVNINPAYRTSELRYALAQSGCRVLVAATRFKSSDYVAMVDEVTQELEALERVIWLDRDDWQQLLSSAGEVSDDALEGRERSLAPDDPINIQYTSGTTGSPKGATLSHVNILNNGYFVGAGCGYSEEDRVCIPVPFYHCFGMVMGNLGCTTQGACMVVPAPSFDAQATPSASRKSAAPPFTGSPRCSSRSSSIRRLPASTCRRCGPGSWPARPARSRS